MTYSFDEIINRRNCNSVKYDLLNKFFGSDHLLPLWVADTDFATPVFITDALRKRTEYPLYGYSFRNEDYYRSIIEWIGKRNNWKIEQSWIGFTPGVVAGVGFAIQALSQQGEGVLIQPPVYTPFYELIRANDRKLVTNPLKLTETGYTVDFEDFEEKLKVSKIFILCNPHNPTGKVFSKEELIRIAELCHKHNVLIISDEIHSDLVFKPAKHIHIASVSELAAAGTVTVTAPSKTFNIAALTTSISIIPNPELKAKFDAVTSRIHLETGNEFGAIALQAAYEHGGQWVNQLTDYIKKNVDYVLSFVRENMPKIKITPSQATFLIWMDFRELGLSEEELHRFIYDEAKLALNKGTDYGKAEGAGFMRFNCGAPLAIMQQAMKQLFEAYNKRF